MRDPFAFVPQLSNERLNAYGNYTSAGVLNHDDSSTTQTGIPTNTVLFNVHLSKEYKQRFGTSPAWDLQTIEARPGYVDKLFGYYRRDGVIQ